MRVFTVLTIPHSSVSTFVDWNNLKCMIDALKWFGSRSIKQFATALQATYKRLASAVRVTIPAKKTCFPVEARLLEDTRFCLARKIKR